MSSTNHRRLTLQTIAIAEALQELHEVPNGVFYARVMQFVDAQTYNTIIDTLKRAKLVDEKNHVLTWTGSAVSR
jgi:hypothetical protein